MKHRRIYTGILLTVALATAVAVLSLGGWHLAARAAGNGQESTPTPTRVSLPAILKMENGAEKAIQLVAAAEEAADYLAHYPGWTAEAYPQDEAENVWGVDFYDAQGRWIGYAAVDLDTGEIVDAEVPRLLSPEELAAGKEKVEKLVLQDAEVLALLGDPARWEHETEYDPFEELWIVSFWKGLDEWIVAVELGEDYTSLEIIDPNALDAQKQQALHRDQAIELAYEADGVDAALAGFDNWKAYAEDQGGGKWTVSFVADGKELFHALVDIQQWQVLEAGG